PDAQGRPVARHHLRVTQPVLGNHVHFIVEADSAEALSHGMQGLSIRIAKALNAVMGCAGSVFDDHYDARLLKTPTELVRAIAHVLRNHEHHFGAAGRDPFSSDALSVSDRQARLSVPVSWLLKIGWRKASTRDLERLRGFAFARDGTD